MTEFEHPAASAPVSGPISAAENRRRRLVFRAQHRGTYENDLLIGGFVKARIGTMSDAELDEIEAVMEHPDAELADWLTGRRPIPASADSAMLRRIRQAALSGEAAPNTAPIGEAAPDASPNGEASRR